MAFQMPVMMGWARAEAESQNLNRGLPFAWQELDYLCEHFFMKQDLIELTSHLETQMWDMHHWANAHPWL